MRATRSLLALIIASTVLLAIAFIFSSVVASDNVHSTPSHGTLATDSSSHANQMHVLHAGLWRTDGGFVSNIRIKNILVLAPIEVNTVLFMADGTPYALPPVTVTTSGVATVNINDALAAAPASVASHVSQFGSARLTYDYPSPGHVVASVAAIDTARSLSYYSEH